MIVMSIGALKVHEMTQMFQYLLREEAREIVLLVGVNNIERKNKNDTINQ